MYDPNRSWGESNTFLMGLQSRVAGQNLFTTTNTITLKTFVTDFSRVAHFLYKKEQTKWTKPTNQKAVTLIEPLLEPILMHLIWTSF